MALERINDMLTNSKLAAIVAAGALLVPSVAAGAQQERPVMPDPGAINEDGSYVDQTLTFAVNTGRTVCELVKHDDSTLFNSTTILTRVETKDAEGIWQPDNRFRQPFASSVSEGDRHTADVELKTQYRQKSIWRLAGKRPTRIACYGTEDSISIKLPHKKPTKRKTLIAVS